MNNKPKHIDTVGMTCPIPLLLLKQAMADISAGDCVLIDVSDPHAELDFEIWCERFGHELKKHQETAACQSFLVTKGNNSNNV